MTQRIKARLNWMVPTAPDGSAPRGRRFSVPAKFDHQGDDWASNAWSLVIESDVKPDARGRQEVQVHFLMPDAPVDWLAHGRKFTLQEGRTPLAEGEIL
jgi:hypothetical protein